METPNSSAPDRILRRSELAAELSAAGYPIAHQTLARLAVEGGGPPYRRWGRLPLYQWSDALHWAEVRAGKPRTSTSDVG
jgi:hypothetical protein